MRYPILMLGAAVAAALGAGGAFAQTTPAATENNGLLPPVLTDAGPAPAQERDSMGAIVLETSPVRAQRQNAFQRSAARNRVASVGRRALRATLRAQRQSELEQAREEEAAELYRRGAGGLIKK